MEAGGTWKRCSSSSETQTVSSATTYKVRLIGVLATAAGKREVEVETGPHPSVSDVITTLLDRIENRQFKDFLVDSATNDPRPNVIILLNEQDCNIFEGLETRLDPGTVITIIPVAHGG